MALISLSALEHGAFVFAGLLIYVMVARIGQQRRAPSVAFAWVVSIAAFPYLGLPLFLIFGTRKFVRPAPRPQPAQAPPSPGVPAWPARLLGGLGVPPPVRNTGILFFEDAPGAFDGLLALCAGATRRLDIGTFLLGNDEVGAQVADDLLKASARGVATRLLIDAVGSRRTPRSLLQRLRSGGVEVRSFMPLLHNPTRGRSNLRNHRKVALADGARLWSGGRNLAAEYFVGKDGDPAWIDISFVVEGLAAAQAQAQFDADWRRAGGRVGAQTPRTLAYEPAAGTWAQWVACGPDHADDTVHALLMAAAF